MERSRASRSDSISSAASSNPILLDSPAPEHDGTTLNPNQADADGDGLDEDMRTAIAALGIMKRGGSSAGGGPSSSSSSSTVPPSSNHSSSRPDPSRSASTTSNTSGSWSHSVPSSNTTASSSVGPASLATESELGDHLDVSEADPNFIARVSQLPLVSGGLEWYERSKASSRVVKVAFILSFSGDFPVGGVGDLAASRGFVDPSSGDIGF
jgi:hypothetical protein